MILIFSFNRETVLRYAAIICVAANQEPTETFPELQLAAANLHLLIGPGFKSTLISSPQAYLDPKFMSYKNKSFSMSQIVKYLKVVLENFGIPFEIPKEMLDDIEPINQNQGPNHDADRPPAGNGPSGHQRSNDLGNFDTRSTYVDQPEMTPANDSTFDANVPLPDLDQMSCVTSVQRDNNNNNLGQQTGREFNANIDNVEASDVLNLSDYMNGNDFFGNSGTPFQNLPEKTEIPYEDLQQPKPRNISCRVSAHPMDIDVLMEKIREKVQNNQ